jgi:ubiquinone/menaquinone biosynthesis C-methylase UbiE
MEERDKWSDWVLDRGHGGESEEERADLAYLRPIRDRVLDGAGIRDGDVVLDVGAGAGLLAFGAIERAPGCRVIFSDISAPLLAHAQGLADEHGVLDRMEFVEASADDLATIPDRSVDVVMMRSVLIYVSAKRDAFAEFHRVLKPGGRLSLFEPINRYFDMTPDDFWGYPSGPVRDLVEKLYDYEGWDACDVTDPMMDFGERDLYDFAGDAGFPDVALTLVVERRRGAWVTNWDTLLKTAPNPNAHTTAETIEGALTEEEAARFTAYMRPLVERGDGLMESAFAYLRAIKA